MNTTSKVGLDDWLVSYPPADRPAALRRLMDSAERFAPGDAQAEAPAAEERTTGPAPPAPFPVDAFPHALRAFALSVARALSCPVDFVATFMLAVIATLIGRKRSVSPRADWIEFAIVWVLVVGGSGSGKSPALNAAFAPLREISRRLLEKYRAELEAWNALPTGEKMKTPRPVLRQLLTRNFTLEALHALLGTARPGDGVRGG